MADDTIVLDLASLTLRELDVIEEVGGAEAAMSIAIGRMNAKALIAVVYVMKRRDNPEFTLEEAGNFKVMSLRHPDPEKKGNGNGA